MANEMKKIKPAVMPPQAAIPSDLSDQKSGGVEERGDLPGISAG